MGLCYKGGHNGMEESFRVNYSTAMQALQVRG